MMMRLMTQKMVFGIASFMLATCVHAQLMEQIFSPKVTVSIEHAPSLPFVTSSIAIIATSDDCADEVAHATITALSETDVEVIDRANGPSTLLSIKVARCQYTRDRTVEDYEYYDKKTKQTKTRRQYLSTTSFAFKAFVQATELKSGRVFTVDPIEFTPSETLSSYSGYPNYPSHLVLRDKVIEASAIEILRMFTSWREEKKVTFYKNKKCGLRTAYNALKAGAYDQALESAESSARDCGSGLGVTEKVISQALYNAGMINFILNRYEVALSFFQQSADARLGPIVKAAIETTQLVMNEQDAMKHRQDQVADMLHEEQTTAQAKEDKTLVNDSIIELMSRNIPPVVIISLIKSSNCRFDLSPEALGLLVERNVHQDVIVAMIASSEQ